MDWNLRLLWLMAATVLITVCSIFILFRRRLFNPLFRFNSDFLGTFGLESTHVPWVRYLASWLIASCVGTLQLTLLINIIDMVYLATGLGGIVLDPFQFLLVIGGFILTIFFFIVTLFSILPMPAASPTALAIMFFLHGYGLYTYTNPLALTSTFLYFAMVAIGFVATLLSAYLLLRHYLAVPLYHRIRKSQDSSSTP